MSLAYMVMLDCRDTYHCTNTHSIRWCNEVLVWYVSQACRFSVEMNSSFELKTVYVFTSESSDGIIAN